MARNEVRFALLTCFDYFLGNGHSGLLMIEQNLWEQGNIERRVLFAVRMAASGFGTSGH